MGGGGFLNPAGNNFLGAGKTFGRGIGDVATGGLAEFARPDSFGLPSQFATPLKIGAGAIGGGMLGGPGGALAGGTLGGALGGNLGAGAAGGGIAALLQSLMGGGGGGGMDPSKLALGGGLLGYGLSQDTSVQKPQIGNVAGDLGSIDDQENRLRGLYGQQNDQLGQAMQNQRNTLMQQLSTGPEGEAFRQKYNNLGLLNSGAFNTGLANQFGNLAADQQNQILNQQVSQTGNLANLDSSRLSRQFGLEDANTQFDLASAVQNAQQKSQLQQALLGGGSYILGSGMPSQGAGGGGQGAGGGGGISGLVQSLMGGLGSFGSGLGSLLGIGGTMQGGSTIGGGSTFGGSPLNLNPGDPYGLGQSSGALASPMYRGVL